MSAYGACGSFSRVTSTGSMLDLALQKFDFYRQFNRWRQENFFKYMQEEFELDGLLEYGTDPVSPNPARRPLERQLAAAEAARIREEL